ncbi:MULTISPECIES: TetR/AcrR family transcriptional regulator [Paraburkholderia]|jgi:AcrR family transcriptional regulator|uniref:TetR family transcriptional regulator n=1 Tax=Paraburkholderia largidicola TaxID=3014751 RepID=A0A7I8BPP3_9BURK|nr:MULTISPECIES: TetR/AcrR family transcriptional regulator [Paraburkholderia]BCF90318.1 TetR family transcriptional regulator [Paraburkholderia sp. PGU16]
MVMATKSAAVGSSGRDEQVSEAQEGESTGAQGAPAARRPGRPSGSGRGPEQRARLLDAALALFARQGIVDTTLGQVAREAGFTPAMMHYYFKTRDQLLDVLIDERFLPLRAKLSGSFQTNPDDPIAGITLLAQRFVEVAGDYPWFPSLWIREVISEGGLLKQRMHERFGNANQKSGIEFIEKWQKEGKLNRELEPSLVFLSVIGLTILPLATSSMWRNDPARRKLTADDIARHAVALLTHGVTPPAAA